MLNLTDLAIFSQVAETKSFSTAALRLGLSKATISKHIADLEKTLGIRLLHRTTRRVGLTDAGAALYQHCIRIMAEADQAAAAVAKLNEPSCVLRVAAPMPLGMRCVVPAVVEILRCFPGIAVDLALTHALTDNEAETFDLSVRISRTPDDSLIWRPLMPCQTIACAAPHYLAQAGRLDHPHDLRDHNCLLYAAPDLWQFWKFEKDGQEFIVRVSGNFRTDDADAMRAAVRDGLGVTVLPKFYIDSDLRAGTIRPVLEEYVAPEYMAYIVYPFTHRSSPAVLALADRIAGRCGEMVRAGNTTTPTALSAASDLSSAVRSAT